MSLHDETYHWLWTAWFVIIWIASCGYFAYRRKGRYSLWGVFLVVTGAAIPFAVVANFGGAMVVLLVLQIYAILSAFLISGAGPNTGQDRTNWLRFVFHSSIAGGWISAVAWTCPVMLTFLLRTYQQVASARFANWPLLTVPTESWDSSLRMIFVGIPLLGIFAALFGAVLNAAIALLIWGVVHSEKQYCARNGIGRRTVDRPTLPETPP